MKKFTTLICLMLCVIVGSLYATWTYVDKTATQVDSDVTVSLAGKVSAECGEIAITGNPSFEIDEADSKTHTAKLTWTTPEITISFTPDSRAPETVLTNGITVVVKIALTGLDGVVRLTENNFDVTPTDTDSDGVFTATVDLSAKIVIDPAFALETESEYDTFQSTTKEVKVTVSQKN